MKAPLENAIGDFFYRLVRRLGMASRGKHRWHAFEHKSEPLLSPSAFARRMVRCSVAAGILVVGSLAMGMVGYHSFEGLSWIDAFLNAAMLLGGMGPITDPQTIEGKLFAGLYALYCGLVVILTAGVILAPVAHRLLHRFHIEDRS